MTKPVKVKSRLTTQNMNTATKLMKARTRKPTRLHKYPKITCLKENQKDTQRSNKVPCGKVQIRIINIKQDTKQLLKKNSYLTHMTASASWVAETVHSIIESCIKRENNKSERQGRRRGKPLWQDEKVKFERLA